MDLATSFSQHPSVPTCKGVWLANPSLYPKLLQPRDINWTELLPDAFHSIIQTFCLPSPFLVYSLPSWPLGLALPSPFTHGVAQSGHDHSGLSQMSLSLTITNFSSTKPTCTSFLCISLCPFLFFLFSFIDHSGQCSWSSDCLSFPSDGIKER